MKKVMVTGGSGLVGSELVRQLSRSNKYEIISLSRTKNTSELLPNVSFYDNSDLFAGRVDIKEVDFIVNCAFSRSNKCEDLSSGLAFSFDLLRHVKENSSASVINISTQGLYYQPLEPTLIKETDRIEPKDCYGVTKQAVEHLMDAIFSDGINRYTNVRLSSVNFKQRFTQYFVNACIDRTSISVHGKEQRTSLIDVRDVAKGLIALITLSAEKWQKNYNLGTARVNTIFEVANITNQVAIEVFGYKPTPIRLVDREIVPFSAMDISRLNKDTGWVPEISVKEMVINMFNETLKER
jgi:nucleoside-diphosphate-sugar epimerase